MSSQTSHSFEGGVPAPIAQLGAIMDGYGGFWCLCGGWAVDAWLGRQTREHKDVDIAVFHDDLDLLFEHLAGWDLRAHDAAEPDSDGWGGRRLYLPAHIHARLDGYELDIQINERSGSMWVLKPEPRLEIEVSRAVGRCAPGLPALQPEVVLFYKALDGRPQDEADRAVLLPLLGEAQVAWLQGAEARNNASRW